LPTSALDIGAILVLVLPGFLSYRSALARRADPSRRSALWQLSEMLEFSVYVHLLGVALVFGVTALLDSAFHLESHLSELPGRKPHEFLSAYFVEGTLLFTLYPLYVVVAAVLMGAYEAPNRAATGIVKGGGLLARGIGAVPGLGWIRPPRPDFPVEPIWYDAFHVATDGYAQARPLVMVKMKRGDIYYGEIASYPILPDSQEEKDFLVRHAVYAPANAPGRAFRLEDQPGGGTVLLNSADVDSIQVYYAPAGGTTESGP
jgi:hypothetical protein